MCAMKIPLLRFLGRLKKVTLISLFTYKVYCISWGEYKQTKRITMGLFTLLPEITVHIWRFLMYLSWTNPSWRFPLFRFLVWMIHDLAVNIVNYSYTIHLSSFIINQGALYTEPFKINRKPGTIIAVEWVWERKGLRRGDQKVTPTHLWDPTICTPPPLLAFVIFHRRRKSF